jgi:hypothetical protein
LFFCLLLFLFLCLPFLLLPILIYLIFFFLLSFPFLHPLFPGLVLDLEHLTLGVRGQEPNQASGTAGRGRGSGRESAREAVVESGTTFSRATARLDVYDAAYAN